MCNSKLFIYFVGIFLLSGCVEEFGSAGVSQGGSGTGVGFPEPDPPLSGSDGIKPPVEIQLKEYFYFNNPEFQIQNCNGIQREVQLENIQTGELLNTNEENILPNLSMSQRQNVIARVTIRNLTANTVYEHISKCSAYIQELDKYGTVLTQSNNNLNCGTENINVYKPNECKVHRYKFALAQKENLWKFNYNAIYQGDSVSSLEQCLPLQMNWDIKLGYMPIDNIGETSTTNSLLENNEDPDKCE